MQQQQQEATMQTSNIGFAALDQAGQGINLGEVTIITAGPRRLRRVASRDRFYDSLDDG